ncbi:hypothetical protein QBC46DRAFT_63764 [Diplogelasinospora grovesii]|uniref:GATA-type domain-containing protein n=1 Tax=Diplogelasinospora grovesii TaxID=303347 RepID=A0AAN6NHI5_9PEZI|nr:hypothetical protein QBC46DRAFT_63764 [Diplogelasinospora grovesii]
MATAALISPSAPYHSHHSSYSSGYPHSAPPTSIPGMISPVESRRTSDDLDAPHRQSLPSIQEVISGTKPVSSYPQPAQAPLPPPPQQQQSLPSPFASHPPSRPFDLGADKNPSPRTLHPVTSTYARQEQLPAFSDPARPSLLNRPPPPLNTYPGQHPSPPVKLEHLEPDHRHVEAHPLSGGYPHAPLPNQAPPALYSQTGRLPPGQLPLSSYPVSPQHGAPTLPSPFEQQRTPIYGDEGDFGNGRGNEYKATLDRAFEVFNYGDALQVISSTSRTLFNFAEAYDAAAREQQGPQPIPSRLPSESEVSLLLSNVLLMKKKLEEVREMVQQNRINSERAREAGGPRKHYEDDDVSMYGGESLKQQYSMSEVKKRRGRAAPPGRCHSCNRIDTPEWRRGPDGARTLCNACGLHYAKLERKRQLENRSIRPKPADN